MHIPLKTPRPCSIYWDSQFALEADVREFPSPIIQHTRVSISVPGVSFSQWKYLAEPGFYKDSVCNWHAWTHQGHGWMIIKLFCQT